MTRATVERPVPPGLVRDDRVDLGAPATAGWLTGGLVLSLVLGRSGHRQPSQVLRSPVGVLVVGVFVLHLVDVLGRWDPFRALQRLASKENS